MAYLAQFSARFSDTPDGGQFAPSWLDAAPATLVAVGGTVTLSGGFTAVLRALTARVSLSGILRVTSPRRRFWRRVRRFAFISERGRSPDHRKAP